MNTEAFIGMLKRKYPTFTRSEKKVADYLINGSKSLSAATLASISEGAEVSQMTVLRFIQTLGYKNLKSLKESLDAEVDEIEKALDDFKERRKPPAFSSHEIEKSLDLELKSVIEAYQFTGTRRWSNIVKMLSEKETVYIVGFQASKGMALDFSTALIFLRHGIQFVENVSSLFLEIFGGDINRCCLFLIDTASYSKQGIKLASKAREKGIPLVIVTDRYSNWGLEYTDNVLQVSTLNNMYYESKVGISALLNQLCNGVVAELGDKARKRYREAAEESRYFDTFEPCLIDILTDDGNA